MKKEPNKRINYLVPFLFAIYIALLVWIILLKLQFSISELDTIRKINLIPFHYDNGIGIEFHLKEVMENIVVFIPFGIYLSMINNVRSFKAKSLLIFAASLTLEVVQYILAIGSTDITDLITNTCGGMFGIFIYELATKIFRSKRRVDCIITTLTAIVTIAVGSMLMILLVAN